MVEKEAKKESNERFELVEVPTQTGIYVRDNVKEAVLDDKAVFVEILNKIEELKKQLG